MFAHQVIEDLKTTPNKTINSLAAPGMLNNMINDIIGSQKFYLLDVELSSALNFSKAIFMKENSDVRLPYEICWFDFLYKVTEGNHIGETLKGGILVSELGKEDLILIQPFGYYLDSRKWGPSDGFYVMAIGRNLRDDDFGHNGKVNQEGNMRQYSYWKGDLSEEEWGSIYKQDLSFLALLNATLLWLNCKNICTERHEPSLALNKKRTAIGRQPLFSYHTLIIKPTTQKEKLIPQHLWENRIHLCRGHFKSYTSEHPLFGKFTGRYWWQAQARGKAKGIVMKDYQIEAH